MRSQRTAYSEPREAAIVKQCFLFGHNAIYSLCNLAAPQRASQVRYTLAVIPAHLRPTRLPRNAFASSSALPYLRVWDASVPSLSRRVVSPPTAEVAAPPVPGRSASSPTRGTPGSDRGGNLPQPDSARFDVIVNVQGDEPFFFPPSDTRRGRPRGSAVPTRTAAVSARPTSSSPHVVKSFCRHGRARTFPPGIPFCALPIGRAVPMVCISRDHATPRALALGVALPGIRSARGDLEHSGRSRPESSCVLQ